MTTDSEIACIVAGLSKAQRAIILWCNADGVHRQHEKGAPSRTSFYCLKDVRKGDPRKVIAITYSLVDQGVGEKTKGRIWPEDTWALTPLGQKVRAALAQETGRG